MKRGIVWELCPKQGFDYPKIVADVANNNKVDLTCCEIKVHGSVIDSFKEEFIEYIADHGLSALLQRGPLFEALVARGASRAAVLPLLHAHLSRLALTTNLVIIDAYFFVATSDETYAQLIHDVIEPALDNLEKVKIVAPRNKVDSQLVNATRSLLTATKPSINVSCVNSSAFHDRFWLNPLNGSGFISGTSLNGLGRRYALLDRLQPQDAADILSALRNENLL